MTVQENARASVSESGRQWRNTIPFRVLGRRGSCSTFPQKFSYQIALQLENCASIGAADRDGEHSTIVARQVAVIVPQLPDRQVQRSIAIGASDFVASSLGTTLFLPNSSFKLSGPGFVSLKSKDSSNLSRMKVGQREAARLAAPIAYPRSIFSISLQIS
jgi:hypothetical protein